MVEILRLLHDYVAITPDKPEEKTKDGLYLAEQIKTYPPEGTVKAIAVSVKDVKVGDRVNYKVYASVDIDEETAVIPVSGIIGVIK